MHKSQHFAYETALRVGEDYDLSVSMRREEKPPRLVVEALLATLEGGTGGPVRNDVAKLVPRAALRRDVAP